MKRRHFLLGSAALLGGAGLYAVQPQKQRVAPAGDGRFSRGLRVGVIGGGLAGLSAALELAERGASVTLFEAAPHFGGKLGGWPVRVLGEDFAMEHGFHGFFSQYYNLLDVLGRLEMLDRFAPAGAYPIAFAQGPEERFARRRLPFPLNLLSLYATSDRLKWRRMLSAGPPMQAMLEYDPVKTYAALDGVSFADYAKTLDPELVAAMLMPFARTTLNDPAQTSAAHVLRFMHFYFLGNPEGLSYRYTIDDCMTDVIEPWLARLRTLGVQLRPDTRVSGLTRDGEKVTGVRLGGAHREITLAQIGAVDGTPREVGRDAGGAPIFAYQLEGKPVAVRGACTHQGCPLYVQSSGFGCPCHGGRFNLEGEPIAGPPKRALERLRIVDDRVVSAEVGGEEARFDELVIACDVRGTTELLAGTPFAPRALAEAAPYMVLRAWMDKRVQKQQGFYTTSGFSLLDSIAVYDQLQGPYTDYAQRTGRGVVELHAYGMTEDRGYERNRDVLLAEMRQALPELADARVLELIAMQQSNFSGFPMGSHASRPTTQAGANLFLAGDWVKTDLPVALMEAAVTTGRLAANAIAAKHGVAGTSIETVAMRGVLAF